MIIYIKREREREREGGKEGGREPIDSFWIKILAVGYFNRISLLFCVT